MKSLRKSGLSAIIIVAFVLIGGYFAVTNVQNKGEVAPAVTTQNQGEELQVDVTIDYAGEGNKQAETKSASITNGETAWEVLESAIGAENIEYQDYGGDLGIFISGINGVKPKGDKFWLFKVNGEGSKVGVSAYKVKPGDKLELVITKAK
jgi:hypothetical protein